MTNLASLHDAAAFAGCEIASYQSDLYLRDNAATWDLIKTHGTMAQQQSAKRFTANDGSGRWIEIPFGFDPFWRRLSRA